MSHGGLENYQNNSNWPPQPTEILTSSGDQGQRQTTFNYTESEETNHQKNHLNLQTMNDGACPEIFEQVDTLRVSAANSAPKL